MLSGTCESYFCLELPSENNLTICSRRQTTVENRRARCKSCFLTLLGFSVPLALMAFLLLGALSQDLLEAALGREGTEALSLYLVSGQARSSFIVETVAYGLHIRLLLCRADARGESI